MKADLTGENKGAYVQGMFNRIAPRYDLMNRLMTAGQDIRWRREVIRRAQLWILAPAPVTWRARRCANSRNAMRWRPISRWG